MKKIDLLQVDINKLTETKLKRKFDVKVIWKNFCRAYEKQSEESKQKTADFLSQFDRFHYFNFVMYILLFGMIIFSTLYTYPLMYKVFAAQESIVTMNHNIEVADENLKTFERIDKDINLLKQDIVKIQEAIPVKSKEEEVIYILGSLIAKNRIQSPERFFWSQEKDSSIETADIKDNFDVYSYTFNSSGTLEQIDNLIYDLKTNLRIIDLKTIKLSPLREGGLAFSMVVWVYNLKEAPLNADF